MCSALRGVSFTVALLAVVGLLGLMAWGLAHKAPVTSLSGFARVQQPAPDFTLQVFDESELVLSQLRGRPVVINFWASWCPPCREEALDLERAWRVYQDDVLFIGLDILDREEKARAYLKEFGITYPNGQDADSKITVEYGVIGLPVTFFVSREGIVERRWVGTIDERTLFTWVEELASGISPTGQTEGANLEEYFELDG